MDNLNLGSDESIVRKIPRIIIGGVRCEAVLTGRRIIIAERGTGTIREDIPYADISLALSGVNAGHEPVLTINFSHGGDGPRSADLVFVYQPAGQNIQDLEKCVAILREGGVPFQNNGLLSATNAASRIAAVSAGLQADTGADARTPALERTVAGRPWQPRQAPPEDAREKSHVATIAVIAVIIMVLIGGAFIADQVMKAKNSPAPVTAPKPAAASTVMATPVPGTAVPLTPSPSPTPAPAESTVPAAMTIPAQGIWAKVSYPGNYSGSIGAHGWRTEVNGSGTRIIQLPIQNAVIDGSVEKGDGSADRLEVMIYNGGALVSRSETTRPFGVIDLQVPVGLSLGSSPVPTPTPGATAVVPTPDPSLVLHAVPPAGIWVRVSSPGEFSGSIGSNGDWRKVSGSGDQFYQMVMKSGMVEALLEKADGSGKDLVVGVYKDGAMVAYGNTSKPKGIVEIHTMV